MYKVSSARYHQDNKERLLKKAREKYQSPSNKGKEIKQQYDRERYKNLSED